MARPPRVYHLTAAQRTQPRAGLRQHGLAPRTRIRLECVRLADLGWTAPQIAAQVGVCAHTVRGRCGGLWPAGWTPWPIVTISPGRLRALLHQRGYRWTRPQPT